ncbi:MAG: N-acetylneuraminate synthase family protein [Gemmatimonadetes bacterium]|nr:N-acetylneuraminate synthase family protein [Gemmatimonadota bacterium]
MARELTIGPCRISDESDCFVIAEIGHNHQGSLEKAREMFRAARECGVSAVKLQKRDNRALYTRAMYDMPYDNESSYGPTYGAHREALEFGWDEYVALREYAGELGLMMFATAFDFPSADFLAKLDVPAFKIASGDLTNTPLLKYVAEMGKPMLVSTGGAHMEDVERASETIMPVNAQLCLMQCTASYPVEPEEMNLRVIASYRERLPDVTVGLSDHQNGIAMALVGYLLGARVIEKHFTLNRAWKGTDQAFSLEPIGMRKLVRDLRRARAALGDGMKRPFPSEGRPLYKMGKKLVAARDLPVDHVLRSEDIAIKSPNDGLPPYELVNVIGKVTLRPLAEDENLSFEVLGDGPAS